MNMTLMKYRGPDVHEPKTKTVFRVILMPDKKDQQNPCCTNVSTLKWGVQPTVPLNVIKTHWGRR
jgi:hypothetical protein